MGKKIAIPNYIIIENSVFLDKRLTFSDIIVYGFISALSNNSKRGCFCSNKYLCKITNLKLRQIQYILSHLKECNHITIDFENGQRTIRTFIDKEIYKRDNPINFINLEDYDWLENNE